MAPFTDTTQPRDHDGRYGRKTNTAPDTTLTPEVRDPWGQYPVLPTAFTAEYETADSYEAVDDTYISLRRTNDDEFGVRWGAVNRTRELRTEGAPGIPSDLDGRHPFRDAQNTAELDELFALATEELHGDGMNSKSVQNRLYDGYRTQMLERRTELIAHRTQH